MKKRKDLGNQLIIFKSLSIVFGIFSMTIILFLFLSPQFSKPFTKEKIIYKGNYSGVERYNIDMIILSVKQEYLNTVKTIEVTDRQSMFDIQGMNGNHNIRIYYDYETTEEHFKEVLCHEILHNVVNKYSGEYFVQDLNQKLPCFYSQ